MANALPKIATGIGAYDLTRQRTELALYSSDNANGSRNSR
jgi:hypothetical protein